MRQYETGFLLSPQLSEDDAEAVIQQMADIVAQRRGKMIKIDRWGKRRTAYILKKFHDAYYVFFHYEAEAAVPSELARRFRQMDTVLRYLTLVKETRQNVRWKKKSQLKPKSPAAAGEPGEAAGSAEPRKTEEA